MYRQRAANAQVRGRVGEVLPGVGAFGRIVEKQRIGIVEHLDARAASFVLGIVQSDQSLIRRADRGQVISRLSVIRSPMANMRSAKHDRLCAKRRTWTRREVRSTRSLVVGDGSPEG